MTVAPGATWALNEGASFANAHDGTLALQIASKTRLGVFQLSAPCCQGAGKLTAGGALSPDARRWVQAVRGLRVRSLPAPGRPVRGHLRERGGGFSGDYSHETATPAYAGVTYGAGAGKKKG